MQITTARHCSFCVLAVTLLAITTLRANGEVLWGGDVSPNPTTTDDTQTLYVGQTAFGEMTINDGSTVESSISIAADGAGSNAHITVTGEDSTWHASDFHRIGNSGTATVYISDGGSLVSGTQSVNDSTVGHANGGSGTVTVTGTNSSWSIANGNLILGGESMDSPSSGAGSVTIEQGGTLNVTTGTIRIHGNGFSIFHLDAGGTVNALNIDASGGGNFNWTAGLLNLSGTYTGDLEIPSYGTLTGNTTVTGDLVNDGILRPGHGTGTTTVHGSYTQMGLAELRVEIAGHTPGLFDVLHVTEDASIAGVLVVDFINGYTPNAGNHFQFLAVEGQTSGLWYEIHVLNLDLPYSIDPNTGTFTVLPEPASVMLFLAGSTLFMLRRA